MKLRQMPEEEVSFQMSPMIDIVFQLIIFFMLVSTFHNLSTIEGIKLPKADQAKEREPMPGDMLINVKKDGVMVVNQKTYTAEQLLPVLLDTVAKNPNIDFTVTIRADAETTSQDVFKAVKICSTAGIYKIAFSALQRVD